MRNVITLLLLTLCVGIGYSQVSKVKATSYKGLTTAERDALDTSGFYPIIFNTTTGQFEQFNGSTWSAVGSGAASGVAWGFVTGTLSDQTDLQSALDAKLNLTGGTLTGDLIVPTETYGVGWNGSNEVPTKDAVYDKIETVVAGGGGASQLSDLTDVNTSTPTNRNVLIADGVDFESRALTEADISDLSHTTNTDSQTLSLAANNLSISGGNSVSLAGYLDNTDTQDLSLLGNTLFLTNSPSIDLSNVSVNTAMIVDGTITAVDMANNSVGVSQLVDNAVNGNKVQDGTLSEADLNASTNASLDLADSSVQPGDNISGLTNDAGYITSQTDDQTAAEVSVADAGGNYTATDVEGVLAEIAPLLGATVVDGDKGDITVSSGVWSVDSLAVSADFISYDPTVSGLNATNVKSGLDEVAIEELTQAEFDALSTAEKLALGPYIILPAAPSGYSVTIDNDPVNGLGSDSFTFASAEVGAFYDYSFSSTGGGTPVTGFGTIETATDQITGINLSGLGDGTITLSATLTNAGGAGAPATDTATKGAGGGTDLFDALFANAAAASDENATTGWTSFQSSISSVSNTDGGGGGSNAMRAVSTADGWSTMEITMTGLSLVPHTATIRMRGLSEHAVFGWTNVSPVSYGTTAHTDGTWYERTVTFTPTSASVTIKIYAGQVGGANTTGDYVEVSSIVVVEN